MQLDWTTFKGVVVARSLSIQYVVVGLNYWLKAFDGTFEVECLIPTDNTLTDTIDFETNYKSAGNKSPIQNTTVTSLPAFGAKTITVSGVVKKLYARNTGIQATLTTGSNDITYTATYAWVKFIGIEVVNCEALDTAELRVYDTAQGTYSGYANALLNQFGYTMNMPAGFYEKQSPFDADLYQGMVMKVTYTSLSNKTLGINLIMNEVKS